MPIALSAHETPPELSRVPAGPVRLRHEGLEPVDRNLSVAVHLLPIASILGVGPLALIAPLVIWLIRKDDSSFVDDHGREVVNFGISFILLHLLLGITIIGIALIPVLWIVGIVNAVRGAMAAGSNEYFRYPLTIRLIS